MRTSKSWMITAAAAFSIASSTAFAEPLPQGGGSISLFYRYNHQKSYDVGSISNESVGRLDLFQDVPGYGRFFSSVDYTYSRPMPDDRTNNLSRYQIGFEEFRFGEWTAAVIGGDTAARFTNLTDSAPAPNHSLLGVKPFVFPSYFVEESRFLNSSYPDIPLRGAAISLSSSHDSIILFGGRLATIKGFQSNEPELERESLFAAKWAHRFSQGTYAGFGFGRTFRQERGGEDDSREVNNSIILVDGSLRLLPSVKLIGEFKGNVFTDGGTDVRDLMVKGGAVVTLPKLVLETNYRRTGPDFIFFSENLQTERDQEGVFASLELRPALGVSIYSSADWSRTNIENRADVPVMRSLSALVGSYMARPGLPSLNVRFSLNTRKSEGEKPSAVKGYAAYVEMSKYYKSATPYVRVKGELSNDLLAAENSYRGGSVSTGIRGNVPGLLMWYAEGEFQTRKTEGGELAESMRGRGGVSFSPFSHVEVFGDAEYGRESQEPGHARQDMLNASGRVTYNLPGGAVLSADIRYGTNVTRTTVTGTEIAHDGSVLQVGIAFVKKFGWGQKLAGPALAGGGQRLSEVGNIIGTLFFDLNRNGVQDPGESGLSNLTVSLEDGSKAKTDADGGYVFRNVPAGVHQVTLNEKELAADINILTDPSHRVDVIMRQTVRVLFPLLKSGSLRGRVLLDSNGNKAVDPSDTPVSDVLVYLAGNAANTFTDADGAFSIENLLPGPYEVRIDETSLPTDAKAISSPILTTEVSSGGEVKDLIFLVGQEKKQVIRKVFGSR